MKIFRSILVTVLIAMSIAVGLKLSSIRLAARVSQPPTNVESALLKDFSKIHPIDVHTHIYKVGPELTALIEGLDLRTVNICVIDDRDPDYKNLEPQRTEVLKVRQHTLGRAAFCTTFDPYGFEQPGFSARAVRQIDNDFAHGAVAVKIYKVMGMEMKNKAGRWIMADNSAFEPVYRDIAAHNRTLIAHLAEPDSCWQPPNAASPDYSYYIKHPGEYAYAHPDWPRKEAILAARDHLLEQNPKLRVIGAHLGSMETDVDEIARRFERYPNFAVDMAARVPYLMLQPRDKVRAFLFKYQDRVLYATDLVVLPRSETEDTLAVFRRTYARDWKFFATDQNVEYMGHTYKGLGLPRPVLRKLFHDNAMHWFPALMNEQK